MTFLIRSGLFFTAICGVTAFTATEAQAQANYHITPIGGRSELLGGTGMTFGRDATAAFLNPATAVLVDDTQLSFSVNFYSFQVKTFPRWFRPGQVDQSKFGNLSVNSPSQTNLEFDALPSSLCIFFRAGQVAKAAKLVTDDPRARDTRAGFCFAQIASEDSGTSASSFVQSNGTVTTRQAQTVEQTFRRLAAGPTIATYVNNALSLGGSIHLTLASHRNLMQEAATTNGGTVAPINTSFYNSSRGDSFGIEATLGGRLRFGKQTVGLSIKSPSFQFFGRGAVNQQTHFEGAGQSTDLLIATGSFASYEPLRVGLGTGFEGKWGSFEFNTIISAPMGKAFTTEFTGSRVTTTPSSFADNPAALALSQPARGVINFGAGSEVFMSPRVSLLTGLSTDISAVPKGALLSQGVFNYYPSRTNRVGLSFGISSHGQGGELMLGGEASVGWGERIAINSFQLPPVLGQTGQGIYQVIFVIAGSTSFRNIQRAVKDVQNVVTDPTRLTPTTNPTVQKPNFDTTRQQPLFPGDQPSESDETKKPDEDPKKKAEPKKPEPQKPEPQKPESKPKKP